MKVYVFNIDRSTSEDELFELFEEFGEVSDVILNTEPDPGKDTFSAEITMPYKDEAEDAVSDLNGENIDGRNLRITFSKGDFVNRTGNSDDDNEDEIDPEILGFEDDDTGWEKIKRKKPPAENAQEASKNKKRK